jgi:hypothetical protein
VINGADGTCATRGTTGFDAPLAGLVPAAFVAVIVTVYATPAHVDGTGITASVSVPDAVDEAGLTHSGGGVTPLIVIAAAEIV